LKLVKIVTFIDMAAVSLVNLKIPNLSQHFAHFYKKSSITCLFETFCIGYHVTLSGHV